MGFLLFPIYGLLMGLRLAALLAAGAPLQTQNLEINLWWRAVLQGRWSELNCLKNI